MVTREEAYRQLTAPGEALELVEATHFGRPMRVFKNAPPTLKHYYAESAASPLEFLVYQDERLTYAEVWKKACALATALRQDYGVERGDRVAISMRNYPEWIIGFMAVTSIGAIAVALNAMWQAHEMAYGLRDSGAKVLLADQERLDRMAHFDPIPGLSVIAARATGPLPQGARAFADVIAGRESDQMPSVEFAPDDDAIMLYTSGSTGHAKGVVSTHRMVLNALLSWALDGQVAVAIGTVPAPAPDAPQATSLLGVPLFHVTGCHAVFLGSFRTLRRLILMYKWDPELAAELIERERVSAFTGPAAVTGDLVAVAERSGRDLSSLVTVGGGGSARAPEQVRASDKVFANARPSGAWGMTETNAIGTGLGGDDYLAKPASSGRCCRVLDMRIVAEDGRVLGPFERGELQVTGASLMREYWNKPEANAAAFDGPWMRTGDVAYFDDEGFIFIVDRIKDMVIRGGENIGCGAVEAALQEHPRVREACAFGVPDARLGEELGAMLYIEGVVDEAELRAFLADRLGKFEIPRYFWFSDAPLPRIATGKINKRLIREDAVTRLKG